VFGVESFGFHDVIQRWNGDAAEAETPTSVLSVPSVVHLFLSFDCRLLAVAQRPRERRKKTGNAEAGTRGDRRKDADRVQYRLTAASKKEKAPNRVGA
jgi:hypothetical protein